MSYMTLHPEDRLLIKKLTTLLEEQKKPTRWLTATQVIRKTGWSKEQMRQARLSGRIQYQKSPTGGYIYNAESF